MCDFEESLNEDEVWRGIRDIRPRDELCIKMGGGAIWSHSLRNIEGERLRSENSCFGRSLSSMKFTLRPSVFSQSEAGLVWLPHYLFKWLRSLGGRGTVCTGNLDRIICTNREFLCLVDHPCP